MSLPSGRSDDNHNDSSAPGNAAGDQLSSAGRIDSMTNFMMSLEQEESDQDEHPSRRNRSSVTSEALSIPDEVGDSDDPTPPLPRGVARRHSAVGFCAVHGRPDASSTDLDPSLFANVQAEEVDRWLVETEHQSPPPFMSSAEGSGGHQSEDTPGEAATHEEHDYFTKRVENVARRLSAGGGRRWSDPSASNFKLFDEQSAGRGDEGSLSDWAMCDLATHLIGQHGEYALQQQQQPTKMGESSFSSSASRLYERTSSSQEQIHGDYHHEHPLTSAAAMLSEEHGRMGQQQMTKYEPTPLREEHTAGRSDTSTAPLWSETPPSDQATGTVGGSRKRQRIERRMPVTDPRLPSSDPHFPMTIPAKPDAFLTPTMESNFFLSDTTGGPSLKVEFPQHQQQQHPSAKMPPSTLTKSSFGSAIFQDERKAKAAASSATVVPPPLIPPGLPRPEHFEGLAKMMLRSQESQQNIHDWDRLMGLRQSHSKTMRATRKSREKLQGFLRKLKLQKSKDYRAYSA